MEIINFTIAAQNDGVIPNFWGSALRGAFGHSLKKLVCINRKGDCGSCYLKNVCSYIKIFDPIPDNFSDKDLVLKRVFTSLPTPYVFSIIDNGGFLKENQQLKFKVKIFGNSTSLTPFIIRSVLNLFENGIGKEKLKFTIISVKNEIGGNYIDSKGLIVNDHFINPFENTSNDVFSLCLKSPLRLLVDGKLVGVEKFSVNSFIFAAVKRYAMIRKIYYNIETEKIGNLKQICNDVKLISSNLHWQEQYRYSSRQNEKLKIGGLVGDLQISCEKVPILKPFIAAIPFLGLGKGVSMGLGSIELRNNY